MVEKSGEYMGIWDYIWDYIWINYGLWINYGYNFYKLNVKAVNPIIPMSYSKRNAGGTWRSSCNIRRSGAFWV
jgi:hypothetical protein